MTGIRRFRGFSILAGGFVAIIGVAVLVGWMTDNAFLKAVKPTFISMKPNTAICLLILGLSLIVRQGFPDAVRLRQTTRFAGLFVAIVGLVSLSQYVFGVDWGIDHFLFADSTNANRTTHLGRMAPVAALAMVLLGGVLCPASERVAARLAQIFCPLSFAFGLFVLVGYYYQAEWLQGLAVYAPMAVHTAFSVLLLALGTLHLFPNYGIMELLRGQTSGGLMLRRLLPIAIVLPLALGWLRLEGQRAGLYSTHFGTSLFALSMTVAFVVSLVWSAVSMNRLDRDRQMAAAERDRFFEESLDLLCIAGTDGMFKRLNKRWSEVFGYPVSELLSQPFLEFIHPEDRQSTAVASAELSTGRDVVSFENRYRKQDGTYVWLNWVARAPDQGTGLIFAIARDLSVQKLHEERLQQLNVELHERTRRVDETNRELEAFSYSVSHDLRAPLRSLDGFSRALVEDYGSQLDDTAKDYLRRIRNSAQRMGELIDDLLQLSRMTRMEIHASPVSLTEIAKSIIAELRGQDPQRPIEVIVDQDMAVQGDAHLLRAVLQNLLGNAWKYTGRTLSPHIHIGATRMDRELVYFVKDDGAGFDMAYVNKLFGAFQRLHTAEEFEGNGIGLATVQRIIHRHGGQVWAEGAVNGGATFYFTLPSAELKEEEYGRENDLAGRRQLGRRAVDAACT